MARQEVIDGPGVAAKILSRFPAEEREHLVAAIHSQSPKAGAAIERRLADAPRTNSSPAATLQSSPQQVSTPGVAPYQASPRATQQLVVERVYEHEAPQLEESREPVATSPASELEAAQNRILRRLEELYPEASQGGERKPFKSRLA